MQTAVILEQVLKQLCLTKEVIILQPWNNMQEVCWGRY